MGGALSFVAAAAGTVSAIAPFYGAASCSLRLLPCPSPALPLDPQLGFICCHDAAIFDVPLLCFAGTPDPQLVDVTGIKIPILLQSGSEDAMKGFSDKDKINETTEKIKAAGGDITTHIYDGAQTCHVLLCSS